eukprot:sb/3463059/
MPTICYRLSTIGAKKTVLVFLGQHFKNFGNPVQQQQEWGRENSVVGTENSHIPISGMVTAPPSKTTLRGKPDSANATRYNEEYIQQIREYYRSRAAALNLPDEKKLTAEQIEILGEYINQSQERRRNRYGSSSSGKEVLSPEVIKNHIHLLTRNTAGDILDTSDPELLQRSYSSASVNSDSSDLPLNFLQALQLAALNQDPNLSGSQTSLVAPPPLLMARAPSPDSRSYDSQVNEEDEVGSRSSAQQKNKPPAKYEDSTIEMIDRLTDVSRLNNTETVILRQRRQTAGHTAPTARLSVTVELGQSTQPLKTRTPRNLAPLVNEEDEVGSRSSAQQKNKPPAKYEDSTIEMIDRLTDVSRLNNTETVINNKKIQNNKKRESYSTEEDSEDSYSDSPQKGAPPKPIRRNPESFDDLTQGDIVDYYTTVSPSGEYVKSLQKRGSPGVWVPPGIDHALVKQYLAALPEDKRPVNTLGVQWRIKQLQTQLPRYDHNINYCHEMPPNEQEELFLFVESRKEKAQGQGEVKALKKKQKKKCEKCGGIVECGVVADKVPGKVWHPGCFVCTTCDEILVDLIYFQYDNKLYCGRHHAELLRPRCHACDEVTVGVTLVVTGSNCRSNWG